jgi:drug/metabolite transporter (DMT)-like permease
MEHVMTGVGQTAKGIILIMASNIAFCLMASLVRYASNIGSYKAALFRFVIGMGLLGTAALLGKIRLSFVHSHFLFFRGLLGGAAVVIFFLSISKLGIAKGTVINYSYPIFASILGAVFLRERVGLVKWAAVLVAFVGIYLLTTDDADGLSYLASFGKYEIIAIGGAIISGSAVVLIKRLHDTDSTYAIFFAQCVIGLWIVIVPANVTSLSVGYIGAILMLCIGVAATVGQILMTEGYRYVSVTTGSLLGMLVPVLNLLVGATIFREAISFRAIAGSIIVLAACTAVLTHQAR